MTFTGGIRSDDGGTSPFPGFPLAPPPRDAGAWPAGWTVLRLAETGSTNADLLALAAPGAPAAGDHRIALVADHQTAGRGRLDRRWEAPPGSNLLVSLLLAMEPGSADARDPHRITQRVALAAALACDALAPADALRPVLKWPNDLLLDGLKLAGVLAEAAAGPRHTIDHVVVGLGLNIGWAPEGAACLSAAWGERAPSRDAFLAALLAAHDALAADPAGLHDAYRARLGTLGQSVRVDLPDGRVVTGRALDVEADGRLVVVDECALTHRIEAGDVVHLRPA